MSQLENFEGCHLNETSPPAKSSVSRPHQIMSDPKEKTFVPVPVPRQLPGLYCCEGGTPTFFQTGGDEAPEFYQCDGCGCEIRVCLACGAVYSDPRLVTCTTPECGELISKRAVD